MSLIQTIEDDFKKALKSREENTLSVLRMLKAALQNREIELRTSKADFNDDEILKVLKREAKKHRDSIEAFLQGKREDLVQKEEIELAILKKYLPEELTEEKVREIVLKVIEEIGEIAEKDLGKIIKAAMVQTKGQAEGGMVSKIVKEILAAK